MNNLEITSLDQLVLAAASNERFADRLFSDPAAALASGPYQCQLDEGELNAVCDALRSATDVADLALILSEWESF